MFVSNVVAESLDVCLDCVNEFLDNGDVPIVAVPLLEFRLLLRAVPDGTLGADSVV